MKVSWLVVVYKRPNMIEQVMVELNNTRGFDNYELLVADNNCLSNCRALPFPGYTHIKFGQNIGNYQAMNQLLLRSTGDLIIFTGNDIRLPKNWMRKMIDAHYELPNAGLIGFPCSIKPGLDQADIGGWNVSIESKPIFGPVSFTRAFLNKVGYFRETYGLYGLGDTDHGYRSLAAGYRNYYLLDYPSIHLGTNGMEDGQELRTLKQEELPKGVHELGQHIQLAFKGEWYVPPPALITSL